MQKPPFDQEPEAFSDQIAGSLMDDDPSEPTSAPIRNMPRGCIILAGAIIGTLAGTGAAIAGSHAAAWYFGVEVPWPW